MLHISTLGVPLRVFFLIIIFFMSWTKHHMVNDDGPWISLQRTFFRFAGTAVSSTAFIQTDVRVVSRRQLLKPGL